MPFGKITRELEALICRHLTEAGSPPKTCEKDGEEKRREKKIKKNWRE
jgi:hypothetical protein